MPASSRLKRKLRGPMADWSLEALLLRRLDLLLAGANWQRGGGKGKRPTPIDLPDGKGRGNKPVSSKPTQGDMATRLRNLGLIPAGDGMSSPVEAPTVD